MTENGSVRRCTYKIGTPISESPHRHTKPKAFPKILPNILHQIGNTPLVRLNKIPASWGLTCEVLVKCEFFNAGASTKERIALRMVEDAELEGRIKPGDVLIEPTSGNTVIVIENTDRQTEGEADSRGIGMAMVAAIKGYRCILVMPAKNSKEKVDVMRALGAEIVITPGVRYFHPESYLSVAKRLQEEIPNSHLLHQYQNPSNPLAHYDGTGEEIVNACDDKVDLVVCGTGTGGTIDGIARKLKERCPNCKVVGLDPYGSIIAEPEELNQTDVSSYAVEGIGKDFIPTVLDRQYIDKWYKTADKESFVMARRLIREEGLLCGGSSGTAVHYGLQAAKDFGMKEGDRVVIILPDSVRNYMTKFLSDEWMRERNFLEAEVENDTDDTEWWSKLKVSVLPLAPPITVQPDVTIETTLDLLDKGGFDQVPVVNGDGSIDGVATVNDIMTAVAKNHAKVTDSVSTAVYKQFKEVASDTTLHQLSSLLDTDPFVLVSQDSGSTGGKSGQKKISGIITKIDLLKFVAKGNNYQEVESNSIEASL